MLQGSTKARPSMSVQVEASSQIEGSDWSVTGVAGSQADTLDTASLAPQPDSQEGIPQDTLEVEGSTAVETTTTESSSTKEVCVRHLKNEPKTR